MLEVAVAHLQEVEREPLEIVGGQLIGRLLQASEQIDLQRDRAAVVRGHVERLAQPIHRQRRFVPAPVVPDLEIFGQLAPIDHAFGIAEAEGHCLSGLLRIAGIGLALGGKLVHRVGSFHRDQSENTTCAVPMPSASAAMSSGSFEKACRIAQAISAWPIWPLRPAV